MPKKLKSKLKSQSPLSPSVKNPKLGKTRSKNEFALALERLRKKSPSAVGFKHRWQDCKDCPLWKNRDEIVLYDAKKLPASILFLGEAPGKQEDATGTPFIGKSGQLLRQMISQLKVDLSKSPTWAIANSVCCLPITDDDELRPPTIEEQTACFPRLIEFIQLCQPQLVVLLGESAKRIWKKSGLNKAGFNFTDQTPIPSLELRHPAYLLRNGASSSRTFSENYNGVVDFKRDYLKLRDASKLLASR